MWRDELAALQLIVALDKSPAFWRFVEECRRADAPAQTGWRLARRYGQGQRRLALVRLLLRAATVAPRDARAQLIGTVTSACFVSHDRDGDRSPTYLLGAAFIAPLQEGARYVAARGAGQCLADLRDGRGLCDSAAAAGSLYCRRHDAEPVRAKTYRERQMRRAFDAAAPPILRGLPLPDDIEDALADVSGRWSA
jgi:hypothetical protein